MKGLARHPAQAQRSEWQSGPGPTPGELERHTVRLSQLRSGKRVLIHNELRHRRNRGQDEFRSSLRRLSTFLLEDARSVGHVVDVVLGLRAVERIGGHAKNIAGHVVFLAKGVDVRHEPVDAVEAASRR